MHFDWRIALAVLLPGALAVASCDRSPPQQQGENARVSAGPEAKPGISVTQGRLMLPVVSGNPGAAYFTVENGNDTSVAIVGAYIDGAARTEFHEMADGSMKPVEQVTVGAQDSFAFAPGGNHVMAFEIDESIEAGDKAEMTLTFEGGDKLSTPLIVESRTGAAN